MPGTHVLPGDRHHGLSRKRQPLTPRPSPPTESRTTKLYDRTADEITLDEIERILI